MANLLTLLVIVAVGYWILLIVSRKQRELTDKEIRQKEQFLKDTQLILKTESPSFINSSAPIQTDIPSSDSQFIATVEQSFKKQGYTITNGVKADGIDFIGLKDKELLLIRCEDRLKEIKISDLKTFIADCAVYIDKNPILEGRPSIRTYATNRPITEEAQEYIRNNPTSLRIFEEV
ncbi:MAG: hypothetical protein PHP90_07590 [Sulfuricurvum sp.]|uniref:hypothetical protein n=1 Tax=Sulfuricurvum sp. TaxID=2025608 RepID=UPI0026031242|nr:hypothetical protein [Sulfuricurvum sp.]MDD5118435.1 hypothetical protein [Sulfuricurvum sp.]